MAGQDGEQTTMGSGGPRRTARRSTPPHPGSRRVRERLLPEGAEQVSDDQGEPEGGDSGEKQGE
jgi:hypothetical protein